MVIPAQMPQETGSDRTDSGPETKKGLKKATFAGGCFWCMQPPFRKMEGVVEVVSGYAGGTKERPTYEEVSSGTTGHLEAVQVTYDPEIVSYEALLDTFWRQIDPTDAGGQFADRGSQYRTAIFYHDEEQKQLAEASRERLNASGKFSRPVETQIRPYTNFYPAEEYHQDYDRKHPVRYREYQVLSGRERYIDKTWGKRSMVQIFSTPGCHGCRAAKEYLRSRGVEFTEIDMAADEKARDYVREKTGFLSSPIIQIGDEFIVGFDPEKMGRSLEKRG
jgi:peptide methionine sulfoxide reductase msrA/msrB